MIISLILGTQISILETRIGPLKHLKKPASSESCQDSSCSEVHMRTLTVFPLPLFSHT